MKRIYIRPRTDVVSPILESLLETVSPGVSPKPYNPDIPIDAKGNFFSDSDGMWESDSIIAGWNQW